MITHTIVDCDYKPRENYWLHVGSLRAHAHTQEVRTKSGAKSISEMHGMKQHLTNFFHKVPYNWKSWNTSWPNNQPMGHRANISRWFHLHCNILVINSDNPASCLNFYPISCKLLLRKWTYSFIKPTTPKMIFYPSCDFSYRLGWEYEWFKVRLPWWLIGFILWE